MSVTAPPEAAAVGGSQQGSSGGGIFTLIERLQERAEAAAAERRVLAQQQNDQGVAAFKRGNYAEALRLFRQAVKNSPSDAVMRQNVKNAEDAIERERNAQRHAEEQSRKQAEFRKQNEKMVSLMTPVPPGQTPLSAGVSTHAIPPPAKPAVLSADEWRELQRCADEVNRLYTKLNTKGVLSDADAQTFYAALQQRNALWSKAVSEPLTVWERDRLRLELPVAPRRALSAEDARDSDRHVGAPSLSERDKFITNMLAEHSADKTGEIIDTKTGKVIEKAMGPEAAERFENLTGYARVAVKAREGAPEAGAETVDVIISKLPRPMSSRAEMAKDGGKIYSKVVYRALGDFIDKVNKGFGFNIDKDKILNGEDMTDQQKGVKEWVGFGDK